MTKFKMGTQIFNQDSGLGRSTLKKTSQAGIVHKYEYQHILYYLKV